MDRNLIISRINQIQATLPPSVRLVAVTKYVTTAEIRAAYDAGLRDFGESRIQDAQVKISELKALPGITWHFIGHLQRNKAKTALQLFQWIHSIDSLRLAQRLNQLAIELNVDPQICLQVKLRPDPQKFGWSPAELLSQLAELKSLTAIQIKGLMTILPLGLDETMTRSTFQELPLLAEQIRSHPSFPIALSELSMGMSKDYKFAVQAGATMVRLGSILFP